MNQNPEPRVGMRLKLIRGTGGSKVGILVRR